MIIGLLLNYLCLLPILGKKFVVFWNASFFSKYEKKTSHNMLCLMLDRRLKNLHLIFYFIGHEKNVSIVEKYDKQSLYPMLLKCYHCLHPIVESKVGCVDQTINVDFNLDIFEQTPNTIEPTKELVIKCFLIFKIQENYRDAIALFNVKFWTQPYEYSNYNNSDE